MKFLANISLASIILILASSCGSSSGGSATSGSAPEAPTNITLTINSSGTWIMWDNVSGRSAMMGDASGDSSVNGVTYNVYHAAAPGITKDNYGSLPEGITMTNATSPHFCMYLHSGTTYYAVVTAVNEFGESAESGEVTFVPQKDS